jgi:serine O-acetyltransferase
MNTIAQARPSGVAQLPDDPSLSWAETRALIGSDMARLAQHLGQAESLPHRLYYFCLPGFQALFWHRISRYLLLKGWKNSARLVSLMAIYLTRAELPPTTSIGPSALIAHATGVYVFGRIGARMTIRGDGGFGGGFGGEDIGGGPGYPVAGDDVVIAFGARVLGPVRIGDRVHVGPGALVTTDIDTGSLVLWAKPRVIAGGAQPGDAQG